MNDTQRRIEQALSLRDPQKESLNILAQILEKIDLTKDTSVEETLRLIQEIRPSVKDFERIFPCICFAIATGVGKTRLMGAKCIGEEKWCASQKNVSHFVSLF